MQNINPKDTNLPVSEEPLAVDSGLDKPDDESVMGTDSEASVNAANANVPAAKSAVKNSNKKLYIIIGVLGAIVLALLAYMMIGSIFSSFDSATVSECKVDGKTYAVGAGFKASDGCNTCSCTAKGVACTLMACGDLTVSPTQSSEDLLAVTVTVTPKVTTTTSPSVTPTVTATPSPSAATTSLKVYFGKPAAGNDYATLGFVYRDTTANGSAQLAYIIGQWLSGPSAAEKTAGMVPVIGLSGSSTCDGSSFKYDQVGSVLNVQLCRSIDYISNPTGEGGFPGIGLQANGRIINSLVQSLQINGITSVNVKQADGTCFAQDSGYNAACTNP